MIELITNIKGMSQKYTVDTEGKPKVTLSLSLEVKEGIKKIPELSKFLNKPVHLNIEELQPGLLPDKEKSSWVQKEKTE